MTGLARATERQLSGSIAPTLFRLALPGLADAAARLVYLGLDAYFVAGQGTDALAGLGLVLPLFLLVMTVSNAGLGIGVAGGIARALGAGDGDRAARLAWQAVLLGLVLGVAFSALLYVGAVPLYRALGASEAAVLAATDYGNVLALGAPVICLSGLLANVFRGAGQTHIAAAGIVLGEVFHASFGGPMTGALGMTGAAAAGVLAFAVSASVFAAMLFGGQFVVVPRRRHLAFRRDDTGMILPAGLAASANAVLLQAVNLSLVGIAAGQGAAALAGVALAIRFETLLLPVVFAFGAGLVAMVGANVGAAKELRAKKIAWAGASIAALIGMVFSVVGTIGAGLWLGGTDAPVAQAARDYLRFLAPTYPLYAVGLALFFAAQGAGRAGAIFAASVLRSLVAVIGAWLVLSPLGQGLEAMGAMVGASICIFVGLAALAVLREDWRRAT